MSGIDAPVTQQWKVNWPSLRDRKKIASVSFFTHIGEPEALSFRRH